MAKRTRKLAVPAQPGPEKQAPLPPAEPRPFMYNIPAIILDVEEFRYGVLMAQAFSFDGQVSISGEQITVILPEVIKARLGSNHRRWALVPLEGYEQACKIVPDQVALPKPGR